MNDPENNPQPPAPASEADDRLIHALLLHLHDPQAAEHRDVRVRRVLDAIDAAAGPGSRAPASAILHLRTLRWRAWTGRAVAAAAVILVVIGICVLSYSPSPALASINEIISALGRPGDRTFQIRMEELPEPPGRRPPAGPDRVPKPGLDDATLYLRDAHEYVLVRHDPNGGLMFDGYDGQQSWRIANGVIAETRQGRGAGGIPMPPFMADVPFSDLQQTLARIRVDYRIEHPRQASIAPDGQLLRYIRARRNSRWVKGPETIEIWADPQSAIPRRIIFDDAKLQGSPARCRLTFDLASEAPLPEDWFTPAPHAGATPASPKPSP